MNLSDFDYQLPDSQIAQHPAAEREASRMMTLDRQAGTFSDDEFARLPQHLRPGDLIVLNNTKVFPARLIGRSDTGAAVEIFLITRLTDTSWRALARPARRLKPGKGVTFGPELQGVIANHTNDGYVDVEFDFTGDFFEILGRVGRTPLPPYIKREDAPGHRDAERYQTVFAKNVGAIAAPTAGLHFTDAVLDDVRSRGANVTEITLHVGYGTFEPVRTDDLSRHAVMPERYEISPAAAELLEAARRERRRIVAVGTTTTRALETAVSKHGVIMPGDAVADLTITPGYRFKAVNALLTNFHLPRSSLLILVSTFGGHELIMKAYRHAVAAGYRFYSYGDCMFIQ